MIKGGLAWLLWQEEGVVVDVVDHRGIDNGLGAYQKEVTEGEHNKYQSNQMQHKERRGNTLC